MKEDKLKSKDFSGTDEYEKARELMNPFLKIDFGGVSSRHTWDEGSDFGRDFTLKQMGWVSVEDRLPETKDDYRIYTSTEINCDAFWNGEHFRNTHYSGERYLNVTHWMPIPEPPITDKTPQP